LGTGPGAGRNFRTAVWAGFRSGHEQHAGWHTAERDGRI
jgi:hypothetical protein